MGRLLSFTIGSYWLTDAHRERQLWGNSMRRMSEPLLQTGNGKSPFDWRVAIRLASLGEGRCDLPALVCIATTSFFRVGATRSWGNSAGTHSETR